MRWDAPARKRKRWLRWLMGVATLAVGAAAGLSFVANRTPHDADKIALLTDRLFEFGAVDFVHAKYDGLHRALFECVAAGKVLTPAHSVLYRKAYQAVLVDNQSQFARLDANLQLRMDQGMTQANNVQDTGLAGLHDHHDASAASNALQMATQLVGLPDADTAQRVLMANDIYKDLTDLMVHMAPAVHSVGLLAHDADMPEGLGPAFADYYAAMKLAQAEPINSDGYWQAIDAGLSAYATLVSEVQTSVRASNSAALHMVSGQWLSLQTVAPRLSEASPSAAKRRAAQAPCRL